MLLFSEYHLAFSLRACVTKGYKHQGSKVHLRLFASYLLTNPSSSAFGFFFFLFPNMLKIEETNAIRQKSNAADNLRDTSLTHLFIVLPFLLQNLLEQRLCLPILWEKQTFSVNISRSCEFPYIQFKSSKTFEIKRNQTFMFKTRTLELIKKKLDRTGLTGLKPAMLYWIWLGEG